MTEDEKKVQQMEQLGRDLFQNYAEKNNITINKWTELRYDKYDCIYTKDQVLYVGEIKARTCKSTSYNQMFLLQKDKYETLKQLISTQKAKEKGTRITYINFLSDGVMMIWDLTDMNITDWRIDMYNKDTYADKREIAKMVTYLDASLATIIDLRTNEQIQSERQVLEQLLQESIDEVNDEDYEDDLPF